jgi:hypothetical protein
VNINDWRAIIGIFFYFALACTGNSDAVVATVPRTLTPRCHLCWGVLSPRCPLCRGGWLHLVNYVVKCWLRIVNNSPVFEQRCVRLTLQIQWCYGCWPRGLTILGRAECTESATLRWSVDYAVLMLWSVNYAVLLMLWSVDYARSMMLWSVDYSVLMMLWSVDYTVSMMLLVLNMLCRWCCGVLTTLCRWCCEV